MILFSLWLQPGLWQDWVSGFPHLEVGLQPRHMGVVCCQAQTKGGHILIVLTPSLSWMTPAGTETHLLPYVCAVLQTCSLLWIWGNPHSQLWGSFCLCHLKWLLCFLSFLFFFFHVLINTFLKSFFLYVLRRKGSYNLCFIQHLDPSDYSKLWISQERIEHLRFSKDRLSSSSLQTLRGVGMEWEITQEQRKRQGKAEYPHRELKKDSMGVPEDCRGSSWVSPFFRFQPWFWLIHSEKGSLASDYL